MKWTITMTEEELHRKTIVEQAIAKRITQKEGVARLQTSERNGRLVGAIQLTEAHEILLISDQGTMVRTRASEVSQVGRNTQGVTLMRVAENEKLIAVESIEALEDTDESLELIPSTELPSVGDSPDTAAPDLN